MNLTRTVLALGVLPMLAGGCSNAAAALEDAPYVVFVTNEISGDLTVIDPVSAEAVTTVPLGKRPRGIRAAPDGSRLFIALSGSPISPPGVDESTLPPADPSADGIGIFDPRTLRLERIMRGPSDPEQTSLSLDGGRLFIANEDEGIASVMEIESGRTLAELEVGDEPEGVTTSADGRFVYVTSEAENQVSVIDTATNQLLKQFKVGARPRDTAFTPDGTRAYVTAENAGTVAVVDTATHAVIHTITLEGTNVRPMGAVVSPDGKRLFVSTGRGGTVVAIDTATNAPVASVAVGTRPWGLAISPDGARVYTANGPSNDVTIIDAHTLSVIDTVTAGRSPWGVAVVARRR